MFIYHDDKHEAISLIKHSGLSYIAQSDKGLLTEAL
ncbi:hypothetical protein N748_00075 [Legionella pneumophila str. 121004]|nr:hypothetical protein N748_00075 [Legionella pneumophila str. 121004]ERH43747.1 hypothetical protein N750_10985 [Legionella pneumophila str. Leg01/53]ERH45559.1 hypothetical protein N751_10610 [Legionella pneumophila str. Leg01/11]ERI48768.1 hypothetical protein N749_08505 [Legionella pneumophila str. Leg01/20]